VEFTVFIAPHNFDVDIADKVTEMRLRELRWYAVLNKNVVIFQCHVSYLHTRTRIQKNIHFSCQLCVTFVVYNFVNIYCHSLNEMSFERSRLTDTHLSSIREVSPTPILKQDIHKRCANKTRRVSWKHDERSWGIKIVSDCTMELWFFEI